MYNPITQLTFHFLIITLDAIINQKNDYIVFLQLAMKDILILKFINLLIVV